MRHCSIDVTCGQMLTAECEIHMHVAMCMDKPGNLIQREPLESQQEAFLKEKMFVCITTFNMQAINPRTILM